MWHGEHRLARVKVVKNKCRDQESGCAMKHLASTHEKRPWVQAQRCFTLTAESRTFSCPWMRSSLICQPWGESGPHGTVPYVRRWSVCNGLRGLGPRGRKADIWVYVWCVGVGSCVEASGVGSCLHLVAVGSCFCTLRAEWPPHFCDSVPPPPTFL